MITASALLRHMNCDGSLVLPRAENYSSYADGGNDEHEQLAHQVATGTLPPELAGYVPPDARPEVKLAYDVSTGVGRVIGEGADRGYGVRAPYEIVGTADVLGRDGDAVVIVDWKTGFLDVEPAATNPQLYFYALAAARSDLDVERAIVRIVYTKTGRVDEHELAVLDLPTFANRLVELQLREARLRAQYATTRVVNTREGSWCRHCAAKSSCGSKTGALVQLASGGLASIGDATMTPERAANAVRAYLQLKTWVEDAKQRLHAFVNECGPIDLGDGTAYGAEIAEGSERIADAEIAVREIRAALAGDKERLAQFEAVAIERKTSKEAIKRAAKAIGEQPKFATAIVNRIRVAGGIKQGTPYRKIGVQSIGKVEAKPLDVPYDELNELLQEATA